ncbi:hypothetical protein CGT72_12190 [Vibrio cholerae]|uniref:hypothetical protein n=1 Tax=Vibrio cholerae TaxID=666 RepID=UPI000BA9819F|nr:hypothetical protein [Vibrio cholerae]EHY9846875.1 hypothetical protein [Vibrio cholerae]EKF6288003.1 hypothetical protein [Vibrio cholerae]PAS32879.1 hypothetical protein CGT72_12190 [Vibrio cholerae]GIA11957.1 hypothetical protein VCSRO13_0881 [Vibrio cholerae]HAS3581576.1 sodium/proton-translocating pyrophosphatase [Vibrio cholerae]
MFVSIEKLLNSLQHHVDKNIDETLYQNKAFLSSKWNLLEHNILRWSQRHSYYTFLTFVLASLLVANLLLWKKELTPFAIEYFPNWRRLIDWQGGFLAGQLTIVGVVYPLVIGLIGVLFQNKSAKKTLFPIYQLYSGFMFAGLSGLFLSIFIIVGYFLSASMDQSTYLAICITTALWLTFNVLLTSWFFTATFLMLDETKRDRIVVRFTIHELCETDIRHRIHELLLQNSVRNNVLANPDEGVLKVSTYKFSDDKYNEIMVPSPDPIRVTNVYFSIINAIIHYQVKKLKVLRWLNRQSLVKRLVSKKGFSWLHLDLNAEPEFVLQPIWTNENETGLVIVRYSGFDLSWLSKMLIKLSFTIKKNKDNDERSLTSMMLGLVGSANDSIREKNIGEFKYALDNIVKWHIEIASALSFINDNKEDDNWLLLPTTNFFSRSYLDEILTEYYQIAKSSVELIPENIEFFDEVIYLHKRLFSRREKLVKREGFLLIQGSYFTWSLLMEWRSYSSSSSDMRVANKYEDVLFDFVGSWESWLDYIEPRRKRLDSLTESLPLFLTHLEFTAHTAITALRYNNDEAAGWGVDMLNNWCEKLSVRDYGHGLEEYRWHSELVTHDMLLKSLDDKNWIVILNGHQFNLKSAFNIAFENAAFDLRVITACYMLLKPNLNDNERIRQYIKALLSNAAIHPTGAIGRRTKSISNASDVVGTYIRHRDYPNYGSGSYGSWISKVLESFGRVNEKRRVSGRIYSGWGRNDVQSMNIAYVEIAVSFSNSQWQLGRKWFDIIFSDAFRYQDQQSLVRDLQEWLRLVDEIKDPFLISKEQFDSNLDNFKTSIQQVIDQLNQRQNQLVAEADIDEDLLTKFGIACSKAFMGEDANFEFPINLFKSVGFNGNPVEETLYKLNIQGYPKENIAKNIEANRAVNEESWLKESTRNNVEVNILRKLLQYKTSDSKVYTNAENNIFDISNLTKDITNPVLFSGSSELNQLLREARYKPEIANKFDISFIDGFGNNYICNLGDIIVYSLHFSDVNFSLLTTRDLFESIVFGKVMDNQFVEVNYVPSQNENVGELSINYWMKVDLVEELPCIKTEIKSIDKE